jgi:hypothetical protein
MIYRSLSAALSGGRSVGGCGSVNGRRWIPMGRPRCKRPTSSLRWRGPTFAAQPSLRASTHSKRGCGVAVARAASSQRGHILAAGSNANAKIWRNLALFWRSGLTGNGVPRRTLTGIFWRQEWTGTSSHSPGGSWARRGVYGSWGYSCSHLRPAQTVRIHSLSVRRGSWFRSWGDRILLGAVHWRPEPSTRSSSRLPFWEGSSLWPHWS